MKPFEGINVLEFSTMVTASFSAMMLAEQGANVIKVEPLELGDPMRYLGSSKGGISALFANCNRGKESLRLDLKQAAGKEIVKELAATTDIVLCNFRPGIMDALDLGADALRAINPRLIYAAVSGFGTKGPDKDKPAYDPVIQAQAGFTAAQGHHNSSHEFVRNLNCDKITAYTVCQAVTAALYTREKTSEGQYIELSMMDAGLYYLFPDGFMHETLLDDDAEQAPPLSALLYNMTITKDGGLTLSAANKDQQVGLLAAVDLLPLFADERFNSSEKIVENIEEFRDIVAEKIATFGTDELLERLAENDVPAAKCLDYAEVLDHPQYAANDSLDVFDHPRMGRMRRIKPPAMFGGQRLEPASASPAHGEHTRAVLARMGKTDGEITALLEDGIVKEL